MAPNLADHLLFKGSSLLKVSGMHLPDLGLPLRLAEKSTEGVVSVTFPSTGACSPAGPGCQSLPVCQTSMDAAGLLDSRLAVPAEPPALLHLIFKAKLLLTMASSCPCPLARVAFP